MLAIFLLQNICFLTESPNKRQACLSLLSSLCCSLTPALPKAVGWDSSRTCQAWVPWCLQECPPYGKDSGVKVKFTLALLNEIFTPCFRGSRIERAEYLRATGKKKKGSKIVVILLSSRGFKMTHKWDSSCVTFKHREPGVNLVNNLKKTHIKVVYQQNYHGVCFH